MVDTEDFIQNNVGWNVVRGPGFDSLSDPQKVCRCNRSGLTRNTSLEPSPLQQGEAAACSSERGRPTSMEASVTRQTPFVSGPPEH